MSKELAGLIKWSRRPEWQDVFDVVLDEHFGRALDDYDLTFETLEKAIGPQAMDALWTGVLEDFATRTPNLEDEADDAGEEGPTIVDDYLQRRGWKESPSARRYLTGLRDSMQSIYAVGEVVPGQSMWLSDLLRGGEPVQVFDQSATLVLKPGRRIACRVIDMNGRNRMSSCYLPFDDATAAALVDRMEAAFAEEQQAFLAEIDDAGLADTVPEGIDEAAAFSVLLWAAPQFTAARLDELLAGKVEKAPPPRFNSDGEELEYNTVFYPYTAGTKADAVVALLADRPELRPETATVFNWVDADASGAYTAMEGRKYQERRGDRLHLELEDGTEVLAGIVVGADGVSFASNSRARADRAKVMLKSLLKGLVGTPRVEVASYEEMHGRA